MVRITIDDELKKKLLAADGVVELVDHSGVLLGRVVPEAGDFSGGWAPVTPEISDDELRRRLESDEPGISTDELIARLKARQ